MVVRSSIAANGYVGRVTSDDAPPPSRRAARTSTAPIDPVVVRNREGRQALGWVDEETVTGAADTPSSSAGAPDLLARRPRRSPLRAGVVMPVLTTVGVCGVYVAATLLWPLWAVAPTVREITPDGPVATASAVTWPAAGAGAAGVAGIDAVAASSPAPVSMASISKVVTVLMILDEMPLAVGQSGPEFTFTSRDRDTYWDYLSEDESALDVPVGGSLTEYQMLQGILVGSAGNYTNRLASTLWPTDEVFARAARAWLDRHGLGAITLSEPTGIDPANTAEPAALVTLAQLALAHPVVAEIARTRTVELPGAGEVTNTNDLLSDPGVVGLKTGSLADSYNLLAAKDITVGTTTVRVYATALGQPTGEARDQETARLLTEVAAEVSTPKTMPAGTLAGVVSTAWGATANIVTDADAAVILWNGAAATATTTLDLGSARTANAPVGQVLVRGPLDAVTVGVHLTADIPDPDAWWRLTHPLQLWGLAG